MSKINSELTFKLFLRGWVLKMKLMLNQLPTKLHLKLKLSLAIARTSLAGVPVALAHCMQPTLSSIPLEHFLPHIPLVNLEIQISPPLASRLHATLVMPMDAYGSAQV